MTTPFSQIRRFNPWARAAIALYLLGALFLVAVHQHHGGLQGPDCGLCTIAHTPATAAPAALHLGAPALTSQPLPILVEHRWDSEPGCTCRTRAPPLV